MKHKKGRSNRHDIGVWILSGILVALVCSSGFIGWDYFFNLRRPEMARESLLRVGQACKKYAYKNQDEYWPPVSFRPRAFTLDASLLDPNYAEASDLESPAVPANRRPLSGRSYYYLGYAVFNEDEGIALIDAIRDADTSTLEPFASIETESNKFFAIREGIERKLINETNGASAALSSAEPEPLHSQFLRWLLPVAEAHSYSLGLSEMPVLIEHPDLFGDGGHVLYLDGHVEFVQYPGKFPMTERFITAMESLEPASR